MQWRVVYTDSESATGVAPVCEKPHESGGAYHVLNCCPYPHIETYSEFDALALALRLSAVDAKLCG